MLAGDRIREGAEPEWRVQQVLGLQSLEPKDFREQFYTFLAGEIDLETFSIALVLPMLSEREQLARILSS